MKNEDVTDTEEIMQDLISMIAKGSPWNREQIMLRVLSEPLLNRLFYAAVMSEQKLRDAQRKP